MSSFENPTWTKPRDTGAPMPLALGTMNFGKRTPETDAARIVDRALDLGITLFDTANVYNAGESERILGRALRGKRDRALIATKVGFDRVDGRQEGLSPEAIRRAVEGSLSRLGTDHVELYYLHVPDPKTPIEASLDTMTELVREGKIGAIGVSNYASWQVLEMFQHQARASAPRPVLAQQIYNLLIRQLDVEYLAFAAKYRLHTTVYNPLAGGLLTGRFAPGADVAKGSRFDGNKLYLGRYWSPRMLELAKTYGEVAAELGCSSVELAYAWLVARPGVDSILVGPGTVEHLDAAAVAITIEIPEAAMKKIDDVHRAFIGTETKYAR